ncbi:DUF664 domain-containing protein [Streptomyces sp. NPDC014006]|uniref:mycothiol transferase n=1 Tax=Streptomyces sp. NPDC014006 TaxID=3364870 RepID=UPI0036F68C2E
MEVLSVVRTCHTGSPRVSAPHHISCISATSVRNGEGRLHPSTTAQGWLPVAASRVSRSRGAAENQTTVRARQILRWKCTGPSETDAHRSVVPTSPAMTMAALISHMRWVEHTWLEVLFLGGDKTQNPSFDDTDEDADWRTDGVPLKQLLAQNEAQCARSNEIYRRFASTPSSALQLYAPGPARVDPEVPHLMAGLIRTTGPSGAGPGRRGGPCSAVAVCRAGPGPADGRAGPG